MSEQASDAIAIIGMSGRFPGADSVQALWKNLCEGVESVTFFGADELDPSVPEKLKRDNNYVPARAVLDKAEYFDAKFFGFTPRESEVMDPQHRVLLETAWSALESAGYTPGMFEGLTGVFAGSSPSTYLENNLLVRSDVVKTYGRYQLGLANDRDYLATRVSYKLDLKGPSFTVSTGCSTSLVAVCLAFQSLQNYECDMAIAGGVSIDFPMKRGHLFQEGGIASPDGHCRTFDQAAQGTYWANGAGMVVLKRLSEALADGDDIFAVIRGVGLNNDGADKVGFTAPSINGQATAIAMAQAIAGVEPDTISYVEAHGTATPLGDPIEIEALRKVFGDGPEKTCAIGSIKSNFGHLDAAAGIAALIKTSLALRHRQIPPSLNFSEPNPRINFAESPFYVNARLRDWPEGKTPRRAGVSSFGMGGTNAHVILEEPPAPAPAGETFAGRPVLLLSARSEDALNTLRSELHDVLANANAENLNQAAFTLQTRRKHFKHRQYVVCNDVQDALRLLRDPKSSHCGASHEQVANSGTVLMFPGQGCQYVGMGRALFEREPDFRQVLQDCSAISEPIIGESLIDVLYPPAGSEDTAREKLRKTLCTQPALFAVEYALARLWIKWGVEPAAFIGHSIGEFVAAALAGVFSFEDAVTLVAHRARLMQSTAPGAMLSVRLSEAALREHLPAGVELAAVNAPALCVAAGESEDIDQLEKMLSEKQVPCSRLHTSHAFHCALMDPVIGEFTSIVEGTRRAPAGLPFVSSTTGLRVTEEEVNDAGYWGRHLRQTVRFADGLRTLMTDDHGVFLECGPRRTLSTLARQVLRRDSGARILCSLDSGGDPSAEDTALSRALGEAWCAGLGLNWHDMYSGKAPGTIFLPATPFDRKPYLISPQHPDGAADSHFAGQRVVTNRVPLETTRMMNNNATDGAGMPEHKPVPVRAAALTEAVRELVSDLSGIAPEDLDTGHSFLELGLDSLLLTQLALAMKNRFELEISFRDLMDSLDTISAVVEHLDSTLPASGEFADDAVSQRMSEPQGVRIESPREPADGIDGHQELDVAALLNSQMHLMRQQIELLDRLGRSGTPQSKKTPVPSQTRRKPAPSATPQPKTEAEEWTGFGPSAKINRKRIDANTPQDRECLQSLVDRYLAKTRGSRDWVQKHRRHLSDPRTVSGFRRDLKEMVYPIVVERSQGARLWDVDGNEYIDLTNGFGSILLGHRREEITTAIRDQLELGWEIGPQTTLAGDVAELVVELTGHERVAFCNTGSEAVLAAIRMTRTVSGKDKIAIFSGSYHGMFDEVVARSLPGGGAMPAAPGIPKSATENVVFLEYGSEDALAEIERQSDRIAAVLVEPVQSRRPELQPWNFLRELRRVTEERNVALIFDEVITGFRAHPAGVQGIVGIQADLATYGKVAGGGLPLGLVAGCAKYMDALDGGMWSFGDESFPETGVTMFAGTFVRHPLTLAAAKATLTILRDAGPALQEELTAKTLRLTDSLNAECRKAAVPVQVSTFSSFFHINLKSSFPHASLLFWLLREKGLHVWEQRPCFLTTAHTDADLEAILTAFRSALAEMQAAGFIEGERDAAAQADGTGSTDSVQKAPVPGARLGRTPDGQPAWFVSDPERPGKYLKLAAEV